MLRQIIRSENYRNTDNKLYKILSFIALIIIAISMLFIFSRQFTTNENYFAKSYQNFINLTRRYLGTQDQGLLSENIALENKIANLQIENSNLRQGVANITNQPYSIISANILYEINPIWRNLSRIDKGIEQGVRVGNLVISNNLVYGIITRVGPNQAELAGLYDPSIVLPAQITDINQAGVLNYSPNLGLILTINEPKNFSPSEILNKGITTLATPNNPAGFTIGKITDHYINQGQSQWKVVSELKNLDFSQVNLIINN